MVLGVFVAEVPARHPGETVIISVYVHLCFIVVHRFARTWPSTKCGTFSVNPFIRRYVAPVTSCWARMCSCTWGAGVRVFGFRGSPSHLCHIGTVHSTVCQDAKLRRDAVSAGKVLIGVVVFDGFPETLRRRTTELPVPGVR